MITGITIADNVPHNHTYYGELTARDARDLGYTPDIILLDGKEQKDVATVNDVEGWVMVFLRRNGHYYLRNPGAGHLEAATEIRRGAVCLLPRPNNINGVNPRIAPLRESESSLA